MEVARIERGTKRFSVGREVVVALDEATLVVQTGELACVYGASGSGKTTLVNVLAGIECADSGEVHVAGSVLSKLSESRRADVRLHAIGVIFQTNNLLPELTARENIMLPLLVKRVSRSDASSRADVALEQVGLAGLGPRLPNEMSGGQRQRVGIARALAGEQPLLLADEPTGALDSERSRDLFQSMRTLCDEHGTAVVLATHDPLAKPFADTTYYMVDGTVSAQ